MDQEKIGKFIANCRKEKSLTQSKLADMLGVSDRAVSKWENGKSMPDSSIMLDLCKALDINANELLTGERIENENYRKIAEKNLLEAAKRKAKMDAMMLKMEKSMLVVFVITYYIIVVTAIFFVDNIIVRILIIASIFALLITFSYWGIHIEKEAGYYLCPNCNKKFEPDLKSVFMSTHMATTRHMKCPECGVKGWCRKVIE